MSDVQESSQKGGTKRKKRDEDESPRSNLVSNPVDTCGHCNKKCTGKGKLGEAIQCDLCCFWVHASCEGLDNNDYKSFIQLSSTDMESFVYFCKLNKCYLRFKQLLSASSTCSLQAPTQSPEVIETLQSKYNKLNDSVSALSSKIDNLCSNSSQLQHQLASEATSLVSNPSSQFSHLNSPVSATVQVTTIVDEYLDRDRRKSNLVIYGLPESTLASSTERQQQDTKKFCDLVKHEFKISNLDINKSYRLGKYNENNVRPLLVIILDNQARSYLLRNAKSLRCSNTYQNVYISPDLTPKERETNKLLRHELRTRKEAGETNLVIRHGKIISVQRSNRLTSNSTSSDKNTYTSAQLMDQQPPPPVVSNLSS